MEFDELLAAAQRHHDNGEWVDAEASYRALLRRQPGNSDLYLCLGLALAAQSQLDEAANQYLKALAFDPDHVEARHRLARLEWQLGRRQEAVAHLRQVRALAPARAPACVDMAVMLKHQGDIVAAGDLYRQAIAADPACAEAYCNLSALLNEQGQLTAAHEHAARAIAIDTAYPEAHFNLGCALFSGGCVDAAIAHFREALWLKPDFALAHSNLLFALHSSASMSPAEILAEHRRYAERHASSDEVTIHGHSNLPDPDRRLRVGYVSSDFRVHSVAYFIEPILAAHNRHDFEVTCYANVPGPDVTTARLRALADRWRDIAALPDEQAGSLIRDDGIDILVDLSGYTARSRIAVFARRPAPVQVTYLGYPASTGLPAMEYRLTDAWADPIGSAEAFHTETLCRIPAGFLCYQPPVDAPPVCEPPSLQGPGFTFGSFNNLPKLSAEIIGLWAAVLRAVPRAKLLLKARALSDAGVRRTALERFAAQQIPAERVTLLGFTPAVADHLALYGDIDVALDTFPYNGTTTTCEALWMGVPVVTLAGRSHAGRVGVSLLSQVGLGELVAETPARYVDLATELAGDVARLRHWRHTMRERMLGSPLTDAARFARDLEAAYRTMWRTWCTRCAQA